MGLVQGLSRSPIYVEIPIRSDLDSLWQSSQDPALHRQWDLRFTDIEYLPKERCDDPQDFLYSTRVGFGFRVAGKGRSTGTVEKDGTRTSALRFWSDERISLIREGSGYWRYVPRSDGSVLFLTWYDYQTRFGRAGRWIDRFLFRPLLGWATAWSFDRLRLWLESGISPAAALRFALADAICRTSIAAIWIYQGLVPKWLFPETGELDLLRNTGFPTGAAAAELLVRVIGTAEILGGIALLLVGRRRWPWVWSLAAVLALTAAALVVDPGVARGPFNPVTIAFASIGMHAVVLTILDHVPSAGRTRRKPSGS